ncbi:MAG: rod shape-determining protein MreC [Bacteroidales bacterium]|jgi:rod shape-determining protein MreC|nr:rod shape-determining protein MreC [Bacteroidales bacterium]
MKNLFKFLFRYYFVIMFLMLETFCFVLLIRYNNYQHITYINSSNVITAGIYERWQAGRNYLSLQKTNAALATENALLRNQIEQMSIKYSDAPVMPVRLLRHVDDSLPANSARYEFIAAKVINITVNKQSNYLTLDVGRDDGILPDMGVIGPDGVVGMITDVSSHYSTGPTVLNKRWRVSAKMKKSNDFGSLTWGGADSRHAELNEIPFHVELAVGDTVITSGFSSVFPEGVMIGTVENFDVNSGANFYKINVLLSSDFGAVTYVNVVRDNHRDELTQLNRTQND